ncbi:peptidoglycan-binding domain-containing protein [Roseibium alexandrii]|uniref:Putative peptidoglycan binding domain protein n=1 Tax=Roseibium alexandrii (strain DSM 17067 / NCIMB 14079 / DFL-11) TaxID=244592 RepID=A0A5E8GYA7_ROSAD|nr:peptidoglycan-binding domain-containing protein [Roseibium alexandrii]EEE44524.2 putative peptidoglycan binding domain protein [Roseibium alexandrii DFL-11]
MITGVQRTRSVTRLHIAVCALSVALLTPAPALADPFKSGVIGGIGGLAIGGIIGGGRGAAVGALVGGVGGAIVGANDQKRQQRELRRPAAPVSASSPLVSGIQGALAAKGYDPGAVDGRMGPGTAQAISAYQQANGLLVTGQPSQALLDHMRGG